MLSVRGTSLSRFLPPAMVLAIYLALVSLFLGQINDDAFITFRYARFLASGLGPYFNAGEHVEGYTNFLLVPFAAAVIRIAGPDAALPATKVLSIIAGLTVLICTARWVRLVLLARSEPKTTPMLAGVVSWFAAALVACNGSFALNSTTGLETTLFSAWLMLAAWALASAEAHRSWRGAGAWFALACLTRPEGALYFAVAVGAQVGGRLLLDRELPRDVRRRVMADALIVGLVLGGQFVFRWLIYDGEWLPNTFHAKTGGALGRTGVGYLAGYAAQFWGVGSPLLAVLPLLFALAAPWIASSPYGWPKPSGNSPMIRDRRASVASLALPGAAVLAASVAAVLATGSDWMPGFRLLAPFVPLWSGLTAVSIAGIASRLCDRSAPDGDAGATGAPSSPAFAALRWTTLAMIVLLFYTSVVESSDVIRDVLDCRTRAQGYIQGHEQLAQWLGQQTRPGQTVALMDIGIVGYLNPQLRILDITGLTDRHIARSPGRFLAKEFDCDYVFSQKPRYMVIVLNAPLFTNGDDDWASLKPFSPIEERLIEHPSFEAHYHHPRDPDPGADDLDRLAAMAGATKIFRHRYPNRSYLLVVFEYRP